jgi:23S rRNA pseudouridine1911/1915/1917 synthase
LDKGTSGLLIVAKTDDVHTTLSAALKERHIQRTYQALVYKVPLPVLGTINAPLGRDPQNRQKQAILPQGRPATTHYKVLKRFDKDLVSLVECQLETGRTHQIRVHMASLRHPILFDPLYGSRAAHLRKHLQAEKIDWPPEALSLHASSLSFVHPLTQEPLTFYAPLPTYFDAAVKVLTEPL